MEIVNEAVAGRLSHLELQHLVRDDGNLTGGHAVGRGFTIVYQSGPVHMSLQNGALIEDVLLAVALRLRALAAGPLATDETLAAAENVEAAIELLGDRRADRERRGVADTYQA